MSGISGRRQTQVRGWVRGVFVVEARALKKVYRNGQIALDGVNFRISQGELVFLTGPSGAGKTTLLKLVICAESPTAGELLVNGLDVSRLSPIQVRELRRKMGVVFQDFRLIRGRTALDNVCMGLRVLGIAGKELQRRSSEALQSVGLGNKSLNAVESLSWGEQQRVAIARALARQPELLLADEPTGNLDSQTAAEILELLLEANRRGCTVVMATHASHLIERLNKRVVRIEQGRITHDGDFWSH